MGHWKATQQASPGGSSWWRPPPSGCPRPGGVGTAVGAAPSSPGRPHSWAACWSDSHGGGRAPMIGAAEQGGYAASTSRPATAFRILPIAPARIMGLPRTPADGSVRDPRHARPRPDGTGQRTLGATGLAGGRGDRGDASGTAFQIAQDRALRPVVPVAGVGEFLQRRAHPGRRGWPTWRRSSRRSSSRPGTSRSTSGGAWAANACSAPTRPGGGSPPVSSPRRPPSRRRRPCTRRPPPSRPTASSTTAATRWQSRTAFGRQRRDAPPSTPPHRIGPGCSRGGHSAPHRPGLDMPGRSRRPQSWCAPAAAAWTPPSRAWWTPST